MGSDLDLSASTETGVPAVVHLQNLSLPELQLLKRQVDEELLQLRKNELALEEAVERYRASRSALAQLSHTPEKTDILVPLTASIYVPGKLIENDKVLVDIGTGYHVQKKVPDAMCYIDKNVEMVNTEIVKLNRMIQKKQELTDTTNYHIQLKFLSQQATAS
ncbi:prefoldin, alpha subunit protein [Cardiosporidium cionae]|uniref:Prefoldin, alpha subunit protein n=1 Tax=Cardiosporidium cionae TaxID=476202 RepID=A0ABQ7J942_9APIC|nr:prefoldin, alpha subunit protein [Cardiosporidium cionae]|eukprot:KAF8820502.1 prefoldin, alpha subunit protein [Cardiosporidium cionae]